MKRKPTEELDAKFTSRKQVKYNQESSEDCCVRLLLDESYYSKFLRLKMADSNKHFLRVKILWLRKFLQIIHLEKLENGQFKHDPILDSKVIFLFGIDPIKDKTALLEQVYSFSSKSNDIEWLVDKLQLNKEFQEHFQKLFQSNYLSGDKFRFFNNSKRWPSSLETIKERLQHNGIHLQCLTEDLRNDPELVLGAMSNKIQAFEYASKELRSDREFVLRAINTVFKNDSKENDVYQTWDRNFIPINHPAYSYSMLEHVSDELKNDREIVSKLVCFKFESFKLASDELQSDKDFVMSLVNQYGMLIGYTSFKNDRQVAMAAVKQNAFAISNISDDLANDREIALIAVNGGFKGCAFKYTGTNIRNDREIVMAAVQQNGTLLKYASNELRNDRQVVWAAFHECWHAIKHASHELLSNREFAKSVIIKNGLALQYIQEKARIDKDIVLKAIKENIQALEFAYEAVLDSWEIFHTIEELLIR